MLYHVFMKNTVVAGINFEDIVRIIIEKNGPVEKIIVFGSHARNEADEYSDLDLIIVKKTDQSFVERLVSVPRLPVHADVFVYTPEEFEKMKDDENPFIVSALKNAITIYEKS